MISDELGYEVYIFLPCTSEINSTKSAPNSS